MPLGMGGRLLLHLCCLALASCTTYTYSERRSQAECGSQSHNLGVQQSPAVCAIAAGARGCSSFMHSAAYPSWGCRCCSQADGGQVHSLWSVYDVVDCADPTVVCVTPSDTLASAITTAESFCADSDPGARAESYLASARALHDLLSNRAALLAAYPELADALVAGAVRAASLLASLSGCVSSPSACNHGLALYHQLRGLLVLVDGHGTRAFVDSASRRRLFDEHGVLLADGLYLTPDSTATLLLYFEQTPPHLMVGGVTHDAPFATMTIKNAFDCASTGDTSGRDLLGYTARGFNVFQCARAHVDVHVHARGHAHVHRRTR